MGRRELGIEGERKACKFLERSGYKILETNYHSLLGEIDIIAKDGDALCFIEVKTRASLSFGWPKESVSNRKQRKIVQVALTYIKGKKIKNTEIRFDVVSQYEDDCELIKGAFRTKGYFL